MKPQTENSESEAPARRAATASRMPGAIFHCAVASPVGRLVLIADGQALRGISFDGRSKFPAAAGALASAAVSASSPTDALPEDGQIAPFREVIRQLREYFEGSRRSFELPLVPAGTPFQLEVWALLRTIPYGEIVSYGELAKRLGNAGASRAVGAANGRNPIPIVIPCHRVVGADGSLTGFGGGIPVKRRLLALESGQSQAFEGGGDGAGADRCQ